MGLWNRSVKTRCHLLTYRYVAYKTTSSVLATCWQYCSAFPTWIWISSRTCSILRGASLATQHARAWGALPRRRCRGCQTSMVDHLSTFKIMPPRWVNLKNIDGSGVHQFKGVTAHIFKNQDQTTYKLTKRYGCSKLQALSIFFKHTNTVSLRPSWRKLHVSTKY